MKQEQLIAVYGLLQVELKKEDVLDSVGAPNYSLKHSDRNLDALAIYKWLAEKLRSVPEITINKDKHVFNNIVKGLNQEYLLNMSLMTMFMLEQLIDRDGSHIQKIMFIPKVKRLITHLREGILMEQGEDGPRIIKDSKIGASNVMRVFNGECELTKEMRELNAKRWRNVANNS